MNKPDKVKKILEVDDNYCEKLIELFDDEYNGVHNKLYGRLKFFKKVDCNFIVNEFKIENKKKFEDFIHISNFLLKSLKGLYGLGELWNIQVAKMHGGGKILPHVDQDLKFIFSHRIHIPLITNENVIFKVDKTEFYLSRGNVYEINNLKEHSVDNINVPSFYRLHLIIDYIPNEYIPFIVFKQNKIKINYQ